MARIFISHSSRNNAMAIELRDWLAANGWDDVFLDIDPHAGLAPGERWQQELRKAADRCQAVLCVITPEWLTSDWCRSEFLLMGAEIGCVRRRSILAANQTFRPHQGGLYCGQFHPLARHRNRPDADSAWIEPETPTEPNVDSKPDATAERKSAYGPCNSATREPDNSLDMGTTFDCFDPMSNTASDEVTLEQRQNRQMLSAAMAQHAFKNYAREWWHFTYTQMPALPPALDFAVTK